MRKLRYPWVDAFMKYHEPMELPVNFTFWSGISCISAVLKRNVFFRRLHYTIYPNMYIVLVSPPGVGKGSALIKVRDFLTECGSVNMIEGRIIAQKLFEKLSKGFTSLQSSIGTANLGTFTISQDHSCTIFSTELPVLLEDNDRLLPFFCDIWDTGRHDYDTKSGGYQKIEKVGQVLIGACTPSFIKKLSRSHGTEAIVGGFVSRCIFTLEMDKKPTVDFWGENTSSVGSFVDEADLIHDLKHISTLQGEVKVEQKAKDLLSSYIKKKESSRDEYESELMASFHARLWSHIGKTALILSIARNDSLVIEQQDIVRAIKEIEIVETTLEKVFGLVGESDHAECVFKVQQFIEKKGITTKSEILRYLWRVVTLQQLELILAQLETMGFCSTSAGRNNASLKVIHNPAFVSLKSKGASIP